MSEYERIWQRQFQGLLRNKTITDITIDQQGRLWIDSGNGLREESWGHQPRPEELLDLVIDLVAEGGRHLDAGHPMVDASLSDELRVHAVLPPISKDAVITIRRQRVDDRNLFALRDESPEYFPPGTFERLIEALKNRENILISGATGAGKTTLLRSIIATLPAAERVIALEDLPELNLDRGNYVQLSARQPNSEGRGRVTLSELLIETLRMRPDRIVMGEVRGGELAELLTAFNTGHDGGAFSCHASGLSEVPARLEAMGALAGLSEATIARQVVHSIDLVVHLERGSHGRKIVGMGKFFQTEHGTLVIQPLSAQQGPQGPQQLSQHWSQQRSRRSPGVGSGPVAV